MQTDSVGFSFASLIAKLRRAVNIEIPVGYQDETGFHIGVESAAEKTKWPTAW